MADTSKDAPKQEVKQDDLPARPTKLDAEKAKEVFGGGRTKSY